MKKRNRKACLAILYSICVFLIRMMVGRCGYQWGPFAFVKKKKEKDLHPWFNFPSALVYSASILLNMSMLPKSVMIFFVRISDWI